MITREEIMGAVARGWCSKENEHKEMDSVLAIAISEEVSKAVTQHLSGVVEACDDVAEQLRIVQLTGGFGCAEDTAEVLAKYNAISKIKGE